MAVPLANLRDVGDELRERFSLDGVPVRFLDGTDLERPGDSRSIKFS